MAAGMRHYKRDGKTHGKNSVRLFHYKDLSKKAKEKADAGKKKKSKKA